MIQALSKELHKFTDHTFLAEHFHHGQDKVRGRRAFRQRTGQLKPYHFRNEHGDRLAEHCGLRLDAAYTPTQHTQSIDHRGVGVSAHDSIRVGHLGAVQITTENNAREILDIDLMNDPGRWRDDAEVTERCLTPSQKCVALSVSAVLQLRIILQRLRLTEVIHHDRVIDNQIRGRKRVDPVRISLQAGHGFTHRREIHHRRHTGEVLHQHAGRRESNLGLLSS